MVNENNYPGANVTIVGNVRRKGAPGYDKEGTSGVIQLGIPVDSGYKKDGEWVKTGTAWYNYEGRSEFAENVLAPIQIGDKVRIDEAKLEAVEYAEGKIRLIVKFGTVTVLESKNGADSGGFPDEDKPF